MTAHNKSHQGQARRQLLIFALVLALVAVPAALIAGPGVFLVLAGVAGYALAGIILALPTTRPRLSHQRKRLVVVLGIAGFLVTLILSIMPAARLVTVAAFAMTTVGWSLVVGLVATDGLAPPRPRS